LSSISFPSCPIHALGTVSFQSTAGQAFLSSASSLAWTCLFRHCKEHLTPS
jgi:hypothetical protein